jgi:hypothetical protein
MPAIVVLSLVLAVPALAEHYTCIPDPVTGCAKVILPAGVTADFEGGGALMATQHNVFEVGGTDNLTIPFDVKNIQSTEAGFGSLFTYPDTTVKIKWKANQTLTTNLTLKKTYIRGTLELTCDIKNHAGEDVSCGVMIDGTAPASNATLTPGQAASYILDPGAHTIDVTLAGANATLWAPAIFSKQVTIKASATVSKLKASFDKAGHLIASLSQAGALGDFYIDGVLVGTQVAMIDQFVTPKTPHKVEVKNITDPLAGVIYKWKDASQNVTIPAGKEKTVTFKLKQEYLKGFLKITCNITNAASAPGAQCEPNIDGTAQTAIAAGASADYTLDPGKHTITVNLGPAGQWSAKAYSSTQNIGAGKTTTVTAKFKAEGPKATITVINNSSAAICKVFIWQRDDVFRVGAINLLKGGQRINPGSQSTFDIDQGELVVAAEDCSKVPFPEKGFNASPTTPFTLTVVDVPVLAGEPASVTIINGLGKEKCFLYVYPFSSANLPSGAWVTLAGYNRLRVGQIFKPGGKITLSITAGHWEFNTQNCTYSIFYGSRTMDSIIPAGNTTITLTK